MIDLLNGPMIAGDLRKNNSVNRRRRRPDQVKIRFRPGERSGGLAWNIRATATGQIEIAPGGAIA